MISQKRIENYQRLYQRHFSEMISEQQAREELTKLVHLFAAVYGISTSFHLHEKQSIPRKTNT